MAGERQSVLARSQTGKSPAVPPSAPRAALGLAGAGLPWRVRAFVALAWLGLLWERALPAVFPAFLVAGAFAAFAFFGLARFLPPWAHLALLAAWALALAAAAWQGGRSFRLPGAAEAIRRVERDSRLDHRPLTHLTDTQASNLIDAGAAGLWLRYRERLRASITGLSLELPNAEIARRDPWGLHALVVLLVVLAGFAAGDNWQRRLGQAVMPNFAGYVESDATTVEAWLTPPDYTGLPPISLSTAQKLTADAADGKPLGVPAGSKILVQAQGVGAKASLVANGASRDFEMLDPLTQRIEGKITSGTEIAIRASGDTLVRWPITVIPDLAPSAAFAGDPGKTERGVLRLDYTAKDDYGVAEIRAVIMYKGDSLELTLPLPQLNAKSLKAASFQDLTAHPWAGLDVEIRLVARDALGQIGASAPLAVTLPERKFFNPVARAIIAERKKLAQDPDKRENAARALNGIDAQPEAFDGDVTVFLALNFAWRRLLDGKLDKAEIDSIQQLLWDTALALEDGGASLAMREIRRLQRELEEALNRGASQEELEKLMNQLQQAMNDYMRSLQQQLEQAMKNGVPLRRMSPNALRLSQQDLNQMLNDARRMAQSGARDSARQMLDRLQQMLENLQAGVPTQSGREGNQAQQMMNDLGRMMQRQQQLLEQSFQAQRGQQSGQGQGQGEGQGEGNGTTMGAASGAAQEQLRRDLGALMRQFGNLMGDLPQGMGQAERSMRDAVDSLSQPDFDRAAEAQNQALTQMQQSLQSMQQMLQRQAGSSRGPGQRDPMDPFGRATQENRDGTGNAVDTNPENADLSGGGLERARSIFEELRKRRNDPGRPKEERDYLDRLLKQF